MKKGDLVVGIRDDYMDLPDMPGVGIITVGKKTDLGQCAKHGAINVKRGIIKCSECREQLLAALNGLFGFVGVRVSKLKSWEYAPPLDIYIETGK